MLVYCLLVRLHHARIVRRRSDSIARDPAGWSDEQCYLRFVKVVSVYVSVSACVYAYVYVYARVHGCVCVCVEL